MDIQIRCIHFSPSEVLDEKIIQRLNQGFDHYPFVINAQVFLKLEENDPMQKRIMEIKLNLSHDVLFAESREVDMYKALEQNLQKLKRQLEKYKQKHYSH